MAAVTSTTVVENDDYDIHHSTPQAHNPGSSVLIGGHTLRQRQPPEFDPTLAAHPTVSYPVSNPSWWESTYRRVPEYRPVNRELDLEERRQNAVFRTVGAFMVFGCMTIASSAWAWRNTLGRFTDIGLHKVGGEW